MTAKRFYVYIHFRPWNGTPCYVGKGKGSRWTAHEIDGPKHANNHFGNIFRKARGPIPKVKVRQNLTHEEALEIEAAFIKAIGRADLGLGPLVNHSDGGEGPNGYCHTDDAKKRIGKASLGKRYALGGPKTVESRKNKSDVSTRTAKRMWSDPILRATLCEKKRKSWKDPTYRCKVLAARKVAYAAMPEEKKRALAEKRRQSAILQWAARTPEKRSEIGRKIRSGRKST